MKFTVLDFVDTGSGRQTEAT